jgi:sugar/nucleoside kinase (ribokinase family)
LLNSYDQIDATGAGDAFTVGLLHGLLQGDDMVTALQVSQPDSGQD